MKDTHIAPGQRTTAGLPTTWRPWSLLLCVFGVLVGCGDDSAPPAAQVHGDALLSFLERGPTQGLWEVTRLDERRRAYFAPLVGDPDRILMAPAPTGPDASFCKTCRHPCSYTRPQVAQFFFEASPALFMRNFVREGPAEASALEDGTPTVVATWVPRAGRDERLTARDVWFDPESGIVLQIEDYSRTGHLIRRVLRLTSDTGEWDPATFDSKTDPICAAPCPSCWQSAAEQLAETQDEAPYPLVHPTWLPAGFELVRAYYREIPVSRGTSEDADEDLIVPVRIASLLYSDGMGLISIGMATPGEMDLIQARFTKMRERSPDDDGGVCPTLDDEPPAAVPGGASQDVVRWRSDQCRTVARRDGPWGLAVTLLGRNEVSGDDYVRVIESIVPYEAPPTGDTDDGESGTR